MKTMRKALALIMALAIVMSLGISAFAAQVTPPTGKCTINIKNPDASGVDTYSANFKAYRIYSVTVDGDKYNYDIVAPFDTFTSTTFSGKGGEDLLKAIEEKNIDNNSNADLYALAAELKQFALDNDAPSYSSTPSGRDAKFFNLPNGYYLITVDGAKNEESTNSQNIVPGLVLVTVDEEKPGTEQNVEIVLKASAPKLEKKASHHSANESLDQLATQVGDVIDFKLTTAYPNTNGYSKYQFILKDTLSTGLTYNNDIKIMIHTTGGAEAADVEITEVFTDGTVGQNIVRTADDIIGKVSNAKVGDVITITYSATVNKDALTVNNTDNTAHLEYSNDPTEVSQVVPTPDDKTMHYTFTINVNKVDDGGTNALKDAKFVLRAVGAPNDGMYYKWNADSGKTEWVAATSGPVDSNNPTVSEVSNATILVSGTDNVLHETTSAGAEMGFQGLNVGKYELIEIEAPKGYNKLTNPIEVEIKDADNQKGAASYTFWYANTEGGIAESHDATAGSVNVSHTMKIVNKSGNKLPETGGIGTTIFYTIGGVLMVTALALFITKKKMSVN